MDRQTVEKKMGRPDGFSEQDGYQVLTYKNRLMSGWSWDRADYQVLPHGRQVAQIHGAAHHRLSDISGSAGSSSSRIEVQARAAGPKAKPRRAQPSVVGAPDSQGTEGTAGRCLIPVALNSISLLFAVARSRGLMTELREGSLYAAYSKPPSTLEARHPGWRPSLYISAKETKHDAVRSHHSGQ
jgi:hypothetical protein